MGSLEYVAWKENMVKVEGIDKVIEVIHGLSWEGKGMKPGWEQIEEMEGWGREVEQVREQKSGRLYQARFGAKDF